MISGYTFKLLFGVLINKELNTKHDKIDLLIIDWVGFILDISQNK